MVATRSAIAVMIATWACAVAATDLSFMVKYKEGGHEKRTYHGGHCPDNKVDELIANIGAWSGNKYTAQRTANGVRVSNVNTLSSVSGVDTMFGDMSNVIRGHISGAY